MNHHEPALAGFYDHEQERRSGRRKRVAPDWGGDDLFASAPRRRRPEPRPPRGAHAVDGFDTARRRDTMEHPIQRPVARRAAIRAKPAHPLELPPALDPGPIPFRMTQAEGRRTVTITGHPESLPARRRPAPTLDERLVGTRPDRVAAYAFALGLLLIVIAFLSANA